MLINKRMIVVLMFFLCFIVWRGDAESKRIFVSTNGSDARSGITVDNSLKSITYALELASAGDTVYVLPGLYRENVILKEKHGKPEQPICLSGYATTNGDSAVIDGGALQPSSTAENNWMQISNSSWIEIRNLHFVRGWTYPIQIANSSFLTFARCSFFGAKRVINVGGALSHHILVEQNFWNQGGNALWTIQHDSAGVDAWLSMHHEAMGYFNGSLIDFSGTGGSIVIRGNTIVDAYNAIRFRGQKGHDANIEIYDNSITNVRDNDFEPEYYTYNLHIYHNSSRNIHKTLSVDNVEGGCIYYYGNTITVDDDPWAAQICNGFWKVYGKERNLNLPIYAFNNSFYGPGVAFTSVNENLTYLKHYNNAYSFVGKGGWALNTWDRSNEFDNDISNRPWPKNLMVNNQEKHGTIGDILYTDPGNHLLMLRAGSPGIDAGKIVSLKEFDWTQSYQGSAPDVGAYENGLLIEGPPFRFRVPPEDTVTYKETPRIVRHKIEKDMLVLWFSDPLDTSSVQAGSILVWAGEKQLQVASIAFSDKDYRMNIVVKSVQASDAVALSFISLPKGRNGQTATTWGSTIAIKK